jgi:ribosome-binding protein aMBF1 (putative translation factor)
MTAQELLTACQAFNPKVTTGEARVVSDFAQIVQNAFANLGLYQRDLADDFEVAESTVSRWGNGLAKPHPQIQKRVVAWIGRRAAKMVSTRYQSETYQPEAAPSTQAVA